MSDIKLTPTQRRILVEIDAHGSIRGMSGLAYIVFPDANYRSPQGAALNVSAHVQPLVRSRLVSSYSEHGPSVFRLTFAGTHALEQIRIEQSEEA